MDEPPQKRFRYATYTQKINEISVDNGKARPLGWQDAESGQVQSTPFTAELDRLALLDLTLPFQELQKIITPLTTSLAITLHNVKLISSTLADFYSKLQEGHDHIHSGLDSALQLHRALYETCLGEAIENVPETAADLCRIGSMRALEPKLVERAYSTLSLILRAIAGPLLKDAQLLQDTWNSVRSYLGPSNKRYVRRCVADAWVGVIRKARAEGLTRLMGIMLAGSAEGLEGVWAHSLKAPSSQLHSRAVPIFEAIVDDLLSNPEDESEIQTVRKVVIAMVHHTSANTIGPLAEVITARITSLAASSTSKVPAIDYGKSSVALDLLSTLLLTRKGKRFPEPHLKPTMLKLVELMPHLHTAGAPGDWRKALSQAVVGTLMAGKLTQWLSPGVTMIEKFWDALNTEERFAFVNALIKLRWAGVEQFLLPHVARTVLPSLTQDPLPTLVLLNNLAEAGFLTGSLSSVQGGKWRSTLVTTLSKLLETTVSNPTQTILAKRTLGQILHLLPAIPSEGSHFVTSLLALLDKLSGKDSSATAREEWEGEIWNSSHLLSEALQVTESFCGAEQLKSRLQEPLVEGGILLRILEGWSWNREVLDRVASLVELSQEEIGPLSWNFECLYDNLISSDSLLRLASLRILSAVSTSNGSTKEIWALCLQIESTEMSLKNVRERTSNIARLSRLLASQPIEKDDPLIDRVIRYLLSQLKVNFKPLYAETIAAFKELGQNAKHAPHIWSGVWGEIEKTIACAAPTVPDIGVTRPSWANLSGDGASSNREEIDEEEAEYRCHNYDKMVRAVGDSWALSSDVDALDQAEIQPQISSDRLEVLNYEAQLLATLCELPLLAEKHSRTLIPTFFAVTGQVDENAAISLPMQISTRLRQSRTCSWLELLARFVNPKAAYRSEELHSLYLRILSKGETRLQSLALSCLLTYKSPNLVPYEESLRKLLDESKFRDELAHFALGSDSEAINPTHRHEIVPVTIRLLYGVITSKRGRGAASGQIARKRAVLTGLSGCSSNELQVLVDLMLESLGDDDDEKVVPGRQQLGFIALLQDVLRYLAPQTTDHWSRLINTVVRLVRNAQKQIDQEAEDIADEEADVDEEDEEEKDGKGGAPVRKIRSAGIKRLVQFLRSPVEYDFAPFLPDIYAAVISPRLGRLEIENTQAPSGTLDLISAIAANPTVASSLIAIDDRTLPKTYACLTAVKVKSPVILRVFDVIDSLLELEQPETVLTHISTLLDHIIRLVETRAHVTNDDLSRRLLAILSKLAGIVTDGSQAQQLAALLLPMLRQSGKQLPERQKVAILSTLQKLLVISPDFSTPTSDFFMRSYDLLSNLLQSIFLPMTRRAVIGTLETFVSADSTLENTIRLVGDLNAYSARRIDEPDFDRRLKAFAELNDGPAESLPKTIREWTPILRSTLFFIKDPEELSIRTNASSVLKRFVDLIGTADDGPFVDTLNHVVLPGLRQSLKSKLEMVRNEALVVIAHGVKICDGVPVLTEMRVLLGTEGEEENSFFTNITHIQVHRRARALRKMRDVTPDAGIIREATIGNTLLPMLEHVVAGSTEITDHHLVNEAVTTVGHLAGLLRWSKYNGVLTRYLKLGGSKGPQQKIFVRVVSAIIDHFHFDLKGADEMEVEAAPLAEKAGEDEVIEEDERVDGKQDAITDAHAPVNNTQRISDIVLNRLLPLLSKFVAQKDENEDTIRIPLALPTVKLANALPEEIASNEILRVITIVCQILRSKDQDTRDIARDTVGKIAVYLGPDWLHKVLAELQAALQRGPQKHVGAVVTHSILVLATSSDEARFADLDESVNDAVRISAEVIWGESGKDVVNEGFKTKMREVRGATTRGFDTIQLLSKLVSPAKISTLLAPIKEIIHASQNVKTMVQVDEALRRVSIGLNSNTKIGPKDILSLCYSLISGNSGYTKSKRKAPATSKAPDAYRVEMKRVNKKEEDFYHLNAHKFVAFGLDLFVTAFKRGRLDFEDVDILARLGPLVNTIGNTLYSPESHVLNLALKASAAIAKCPIPQMEPALPLFVSNSIRIVKAAGGSAETEVAQMALKTLAVILRDCKASALSDSQLKFILEAISPDLEETDRQAAIFAILRAIIARKFVVPEIYDLMGCITTIMITSHSTHVQESCRGLIIGFLLDYPQGKGRIKSQMTFLAQNLDYVHESGRVSVMELLNAIFTKFSDELLEQYADLFFVALTVVIANDDSEKCRRMAGALTRLLTTRLSAAKVAGLTTILQTWVEIRAEQVQLATAALAVYGLIIDTPVIAQQTELVDAIVSQVVEVLQDSAAALKTAEEDDSLFAEALPHNMPHHALVVLAKALASGATFDVPWQAVVDHLLFPHDWVRLDAAKVITAGLTSSKLDLEDSEGIGYDIARKGCLILQGSKNADGEAVTVDAKLADEVVKVLFNLAKQWAASDTVEAVRHNEDAEHEEQDVSGKGSLAWLMSRLSFVARSIIVHRPSPHAIPTSHTHWTAPLLAILRFFAGTSDHLEVDHAKKYLTHVLAPIYRILDDNGDLVAEQGQHIDDLKQLATEVRDFVQTKVGTTEFSKVWETVRRRTGEKRDTRREERNKLAVSDPKAWADRRSKKVSGKKDSKKRRTKAFAEGRVQKKHVQRRG